MPRKRRKTVLCNAVIPLLVLSIPAVAAAAGDVDPRSKFRVEGETLYFDTADGSGGGGEIAFEDVNELRSILRHASSVRVLSLNSTGGALWAADAMARIVLDYGLDTVVDGECSSSCVNVFLAGKSRRMARGSVIGIHSHWWSSEDIEAYYEDNKSSRGWSSPFEFGSWLYEDTQAEIHREMTYLVARGVDAEFAIEMYAPREGLWYPSRSELEAAGFLRE